MSYEPTNTYVKFRHYARVEQHERQNKGGVCSREEWLVKKIRLPECCGLSVVIERTRGRVFRPSSFVQKHPIDVAYTWLIGHNLSVCEE